MYSVLHSLWSFTFWTASSSSPTNRLLPCFPLNQSRKSFISDDTSSASRNQKPSLYHPHCGHQIWHPCHYYLMLYAKTYYIVCNYSDAIPLSMSKAPSCSRNYHSIALLLIFFLKAPIQKIIPLRIRIFQLMLLHNPVPVTENRQHLIHNLRHRKLLIMW